MASGICANRLSLGGRQSYADYRHWRCLQTAAVKMTVVVCTCAQGVIYPMEVVQTRLAVSPPGTYSGIADTLAKIVRLEGPRALFRGLTPTLIGVLPYAGARIGITLKLPVEPCCGQDSVTPCWRGNERGELPSDAVAHCDIVLSDERPDAALVCFRALTLVVHSVKCSIGTDAPLQRRLHSGCNL